MYACKTLQVRELPKWLRLIYDVFKSDVIEDNILLLCLTLSISAHSNKNFAYALAYMSNAFFANKLNSSSENTFVLPTDKM